MGEGVREGGRKGQKKQFARIFPTGAKEWGLAVVGELGREVVAVCPRVNDLLGVDTRNRVADKVAHVVHACLQRENACSPQRFPSKTSEKSVL